MQSIKFQCQVGEACIHGRKDAEGGCAHEDAEIHVFQAHESGHFAESVCLSFKENLEAVGVGDGGMIVEEVDRSELDAWHARYGSAN